MRAIGFAASVAFAIVVVTARVASAHQSSIKYVDLRVDGSAAGPGTRIDVTVKLAASDVAEPMGLAPDAKPTPAAAVAAPRVPGSVQRWLAIGNPGACMATPATARVDADNFVEVAWQVQCGEASDTLVLDFSAFFALDKRMEAIVRFGAGDDDVVVVRAADSPVTLHATVAHAFTRGLARGLPAACFAVALLLVAVLARRTIALVLGAFVVAELAALLVGASDVVAVPARLVEIVVAISLAYIAAENVARPRTGGLQRAAVAFGFGLAHGLWLAGGPARDLVYVAGAELAIVAGAGIALPILLWAVGQPAYRRFVLPGVSTAMFLIGLAWLVHAAM